MDGRSKSITFQSINIPSLGRGTYSSGPSSGKQTSMRCLRLFVFAFLVPCLLIAVPLYQRRVTLAPHDYTMTASDMRVAQEGISSVWCEAQELTSEAPFTTYRTDGPLPQHSRRVPVTLRHKLTLTDDVREFWGFYLLRGSRISVSACARWPGTSLLLVHGWKALNECVWVGQLDSIEEESSEEDEEEDEVDEAALDPVRRQWREFLRQNSPPPHRTAGRSEQTLALHRTQAAPAGPTPAVPSQSSRVSAETQPVPSDQAGGAARRTSPATGKIPPTPTSQIKTIHSETQLVQRPEELEREEEKLLDYDDEEDTEWTSNSPGDPLHHNSTAGRRAPDQFSAPLTNDAIERRIQSAERRRRAVADDDDEQAVGPPREQVPSSLAGRLIPLTYNGHRGRVNQTLAQTETSHSEMMSSFSSSEEALLGCQGVIVNQPLRASAACVGNRESAGDQLTVQVIGDDYYYLVFSSENEVLPVDVFFDVMLEKTVYDVRAVEAVCTGSTRCRVPLGFWSSDSVVLEYPVAGNASEAIWSEQYTIRSSCQSRGWVVALFIVAALLSLLLCAFC